MTLFVESPWPWLLIGIVAEAVLAVALLRTGRGGLLWAMLGVAGFTLLGLGVERLIVTDRERVEQTLDAAVAGVKASDLKQVLDCISLKADRPRRESQWILERFEVTAASISDLEITFNRLTSPPTARAKFTAVGRGSDRRNEFPYQGFAEKVIVELRWEGGRWLVADYQVEDLHRHHP